MAIITFVDHTIPVAADFNDSYSFINTEVRTYERGGTGLSSYTKGDILYASATNTVSKLAIGVYGSLLGVSSSGLPAWSRPLYKTGTDISISNSTAITSLLGAFTVAASSLGTANRIRVKIEATVTNTSGLGVTYTYSPKFGGSVLGNFGVTVANGSSGVTFPLWWDFCADASASAQISALAILDAGVVTRNSVASAINSAIAQAFDVTMTLGTANANASYTMKYAMVEILQ